MSRPGVRVPSPAPFPQMAGTLDASDLPGQRERLRRHASATCGPGGRVKARRRPEVTPRLQLGGDDASRHRAHERHDVHVRGCGQERPRHWRAVRSFQRGHAVLTRAGIPVSLRGLRCFRIVGGSHMRQKGRASVNSSPDAGAHDEAVMVTGFLAQEGGSCGKTFRNRARGGDGAGRDRDPCRHGGCGDTRHHCHAKDQSQGRPDGVGGRHRLRGEHRCGRRAVPCRSAVPGEL